MNGSYQLASLDNQIDILNVISKYESELKSKLGQEVVLIAYTKSDRNNDLA
jgi:hypothetical protein